MSDISKLFGINIDLIGHHGDLVAAIEAAFEGATGQVEAFAKNTLLPAILNLAKTDLAKFLGANPTATMTAAETYANAKVNAWITAALNLLPLPANLASFVATARSYALTYVDKELDALIQDVFTTAEELVGVTPTTSAQAAAQSASTTTTKAS